MPDDKTHVKESRMGFRTGVGAVKKGTTEVQEIDPMPEGLKPFVAPSLSTRRDVFWMAAGWGVFAWAGLTAVGGLVRYLYPVASFDPKQVFRAGFPDLYPKNSVSEAFKKKNQTWIVNVEYDAKQIISAISTICTHLGCTPNRLEADQMCKCPCPGSGF